MASSLQDLTQHNIETIAALEQAMLAERPPAARIADTIARFCGSMAFVWVHVVWFGGWILANTLLPIKHVDSFPFPLLTLITSLEPIFLTTFVLMSQNYQGAAADRRNLLELQINLLAEQENSKMLTMLTAMMKEMNILLEDKDI